MDRNYSGVRISNVFPNTLSKKKSDPFFCMFHGYNMKQRRKGFRSDLFSIYLKLERKQINNLQTDKNSTLKILWS